MSNHSQFFHQPVLLSEVISYLVINPAGIYLDGTLGGGGHAEGILKTLNDNALFIGLDQDIDAIKYARERLENFKNIHLHHSNFAKFDDVLNRLNINKVDGILLDLGLSSHQIDTVERGFSYMADTTLDMRMDHNIPITAADLLNTLDEKDLSTIFLNYGEERVARKIARQIINFRKKQKITDSEQLRNIIKQVVHRRYLIKSYARVFQSLRIAVNKELDVLGELLEKSANYLKSGGRMVIISYHSLEDRMVKKFFKKKANPCTCPPEFPECICRKVPELKIITQKAILASINEIADNPRARSAHMRVGEKL